jgi:tRNA threonylcarbamoyladenosine biosynthesis protein TsaE
MTSVHSHSAGETLNLGKSFAATLHCGDVVALLGDLGTGKTQFVAGACEALGVRVPVTSPTFTFINEYHADNCTVVHVDLYRIAAERELASLGVEEYFDDHHVCFVEWADRMKRYLPDSFIEVTFAHGQSLDERLINVDRSGINKRRTSGVTL